VSILTGELSSSLLSVLEPEATRSLDLNIVDIRRMSKGDDLSRLRPNVGALEIRADAGSVAASSQSFGGGPQRLAVLRLCEGRDIDRQHVGGRSQKRFGEPRFSESPRADDRLEISRQAYFPGSFHKRRLEPDFKESTLVSRGKDGGL
jgi:hypothetical protein